MSHRALLPIVKTERDCRQPSARTRLAPEFNKASGFVHVYLHVVLSVLGSVSAGGCKCVLLQRPEKLLNNLSFTQNPIRCHPISETWAVVEDFFFANARPNRKNKITLFHLRA